MARSSNPVRFGIHSRGLEYHQLLSVVKTGEEVGFDIVVFSDRPSENNLEAWTGTTALALQTTRMTVTHSTLNVPFRNPALLAKMAATLDNITGTGRLALTLGAGGQEFHYRTYGIPFGSPGQRFRDLKDAVTIMKGLWANETFSYQGRQFKVESAKLEPRPPTGTIPIIIGARGPRMLRYTGNVADGWLKNGGWFESPEDYSSLLQQVEAGAAEVGKDPAVLQRVLQGTAFVGEGNPTSEIPYVPDTPGGLMGTARQILSEIDRCVEMGVDTFVLSFPIDSFEEQVRQFGEEVIAKLRQ